MGSLISISGIGRDLPGDRTVSLGANYVTVNLSESVNFELILLLKKHKSHHWCELIQQFNDLLLKSTLNALISIVTAKHPLYAFAISAKHNTITLS